MDVEYPDIPLGGWAGTIREVLPDAVYTVRWSRETLASIHPICKERCDRDGMVLEEYWLADEDLQPDPGGPLSIQQPTEIRPRPLSTGNQEDRVRMIFGLTSDDSLPKVDEETLLVYRKYLSKRLGFPFRAIHADAESEVGDPRLKVVALVEDEPPDEEDGILCEVLEGDSRRELPLAELELWFADRNSRLVRDYRCWFSGELAGDSDDDGEEEDDEDVEEAHGFWLVLKEPGWRSLTLLLEVVAFAVSYGAVVGSAVAVMPWARWAACIGGGLWGVLAALAQAASAHKDMPLIAPRFRRGLAGVVGLISGAVHGAFFGIMAVALLGAVLGGIAGLLFRRLFRGKKWLVLRIFPKGVLFAAACGVAAQALYLNHVEATRGLGYGALAGLGSGLFLCLVAVPLAYLTVRR